MTGVDVVAMVEGGAGRLKERLGLQNCQEPTVLPRHTGWRLPKAGKKEERSGRSRGRFGERYRVGELKPR